jgi:5-(aminomethyl)-3-furanmethanol phosphate kinase
MSEAAKTPRLVAKLGGSHAGSPMLDRWLAAVAAARGIVLVPGGGPFAETVRTAQRTMGFDDRAAHLMALLGMTQYGLALAALAPSLQVVEDFAGMADALGRELVPVWLPWPMLRDAADLPASWDVTSDSLALWLAAKIEAGGVLLIKHRSACSDEPQALAEDGLVDRAFPSFLARLGVAVWIAGPDDCPPQALEPNAPPGRRIRTRL